MTAATTSMRTLANSPTHSADLHRASVCNAPMRSGAGAPLLRLHLHQQQVAAAAAGALTVSMQIGRLEHSAVCRVARQTVWPPVVSIVQVMRLMRVPCSPLTLMLVITAATMAAAISAQTLASSPPRGVA